MKKRKPTDEEEELRADRWYYKNLDKFRDNPERSGLLFKLTTKLIYLLTYFTYLTYLNLESFFRLRIGFLNGSISLKCVD